MKVIKSSEFTLTNAFREGHIAGYSEYRSKIENRIRELEESRQKIEANNKKYGFSETYESPKQKQIRISITELRNLL